MKPYRFSRVLWVGAVVLVLHVQGPLVRADNCGVPDSLFKDGKPPNRLRDPKCEECKEIMAKLQAAVDDCYASLLAEAEKALSDSIKPPPKTQERLEQQKADALKALGQPADKGAAAKQKQKENAAKDAKENKGKKPKDVLKDKIAKLLKELEDCEKNCPEKKESGVTPKPEEGTSPTGGGKTGGGEGPGTGTGVQPGGAKAPAPNITIPKIPNCFNTQKEKDAFIDKLNQQRTPLFNKWFTSRKKANEDGASQADKDQFAQDDANLRAIDKAIEDADKVPVPCPPPGKTGAMLPGAPGGKGENVGLPGVGGETCSRLISEGKIKIDNEGTGETIGHIADLVIENLTDQPLVCVIPPMVLESGSGKNQHYVCPKRQTARIDPHGKVTVPMNGVCVVRNKPPVGKGVTGGLLINEGDPTIPQNPNSHISSKQAHDMLRICASKYDAAEKLQKDGALRDLPYKDKQKQLDIVIQWSTWCDPRISELTGAPPATKEDLKKVVYKQVEEQGAITPDKKKKIDQGIDTIFEKIELTTKKAKDLEPEETPAGGSTIEEGPVGQPEYVGQTRAKQPTPTPKPKGGGGTKTKPTPTPTPTPKKEEPASGTSGSENVPQTEEKPKIADATKMPSYPFTKETDCGTITISVGEQGELVFDFKPKQNKKCPCKEFGWIQHISPADQDNWRYDNGVLAGVATAKKIGAKSDPSKPKQPTQPPKGTKLEDWDKNPWYGGTTDKTKPKDFGEHPTPQTHISDKPDAPNVKFVTQLVCVETGEVLFTWVWGPFKTGQEKVDKVPGESGSPP